MPSFAVVGAGFRAVAYWRRFNDDEIATAALLQATAAWVRGDGPAPYPLAEGMQDHHVARAIEEAAGTGHTVTTTVDPWASPDRT
jgi:hypothetical protein